MASPKGAAISFFLGLLRCSAPRNDALFIAFVLVQIFSEKPSAVSDQLKANFIFWRLIGKR
jgi:hypothetical protein